MSIKEIRTELLEHRRLDIKDSLNTLNNSMTAIDFWVINSLKRELANINEELLVREKENIKYDK